MVNILYIKLLGPVQIEWNNQPLHVGSRKALAIVGYLTAETPTLSRERLTDLFWQDEPEKQARNKLRRELHTLAHEARLRDHLQASHHLVSLQLSPTCQTDIQTVVSLKSRGDIQSLLEAVTLFQGEFMHGSYPNTSLEFETWLGRQREQWKKYLLHLLQNISNHFARQQQYEQAEQYARRHVTLDPWDEEGYRLLISILGKSGQRSAALACFEQCRQLLTKELGVEPSPETVALVESLKYHPQTAPTQQLEAAKNHTDILPLIDFPLLAPPEHNLPGQATPFFGRVTELAHLVDRLSQPVNRLMTLTGPGGVGKTRLALAAAEQVVGQFADGTWFVPLAGVPGGEMAYQHVVTATADSLHFVFHGNDQLAAQLLNVLRRKKMLLILDNFEHLLNAADFVTDVLQHAPYVTLLLTSRERLNRQAELVIQLDGLVVPSRADDSAVSYPSVQLFVERASRTSPGFTPTQENLPDIVRVCQLVQGFPLGIELAAAWVEHFTCTQIAQAIQTDLDFLSSEKPDIETRHHSMRTVFEHSWALLSVQEQHILCHLSVFRGDFSREAATHITAVTLPHLVKLVNKSWLRPIAPGRYWLHELVRQFVGQKWQQMVDIPSNDRTAVQTRHSHYYLQFVQEQETAVYGQQSRHTIHHIRTELDNIRQAWQWATTQLNLETLQQTLPTLSRFYLLTGLFQEGETMLGQAITPLKHVLSQTSSPDAELQLLLSQLEAHQAAFLCRQAQYSQAIQAAQEAVVLAQTVDSPATEAIAHLWWGHSLWRRADYAPAMQQLEQAITLAKTAELIAIEAESVGALGMIAWQQARYAQALSYQERALQLYRQAGDRQGESVAFKDLGNIAYVRGDYALAQSHYQHSLRIARETGTKWGESIALSCLGSTALILHEFTEAEIFYQQSLLLDREIGDRQSESFTLHNLGSVASIYGNYPKAQVYYEESLHLKREVADRRGEGSVLADMALLLYLTNHLEQAHEYCQQALYIARDVEAHYLQGYVSLTLGHVLFAQKHWHQAELVYQQAYTLRQQAGGGGRLMEAVAGLAQVALAVGEVETAQKRVADILAYLEHESLEGATEPFWVYLVCWRVLRAAGDAQARVVLRTAYTLLHQSANKIADPETRRAYLYQVPTHNELLQTFMNEGLGNGE